MGRMSTRPTISVIIPAYNEAAALPACLESLKSQTYSALEIIVVDNNSTDATAALAEQHGARVLQEPTQGILAARTAGFDAAHGDIIARTDADCVVAADWLEQIAQTFTQRPDVDACGGVTELQNLRRVKHCGYQLMHFLTWLHSRLLGVTVLYGANVALRREFWRRIREDSMTIRANEDIALSLAARCHGTVVRNRHQRISTVAPPSMLRYILRDIRTGLDSRRYR